MAGLIAELAETYGEEILEKLGKAAINQVVDDTIDKFSGKEQNENTKLAQKYFFNFDKANDRILNPYTNQDGLYMKNNRFAGSMKQLKENLYTNKIFMDEYDKLIYVNSQSKYNKHNINLTHDEIYNIFKDDVKARNDLQKLINDHSNYKLQDRVNNIKTTNVNNIMDIKETPINDGNQNKTNDIPIPTRIVKDSKKEQLWAPRVTLGGQSILKLTDTEKLEELKNYTLFDLVTPLLDGDIDNLLAIQNQIKEKLRFYNTYNLPKLPKELQEIPKDINRYGRPMMDSQPVRYPFRLDQTGNQQAQKYYSTWCDQEKTEKYNDVDVVKRSNLDPDVIQLVNKNQIFDESIPYISDIDMYMYNR